MSLTKTDFIEAGTGGPLVVLVHSSVSGARMWRRLMDALMPRYRLCAVNLPGYGRTPQWSSPRSLTLDDLAEVVEAALPERANDIRLVGHSLGGSVAMKTAARLGSRVSKLVLLEANPFYLLREAGRDAEFAQALALRNVIKKAGDLDDWGEAAATFADYWGGEGTWDTMAPDRRATFAAALHPNYHEWDAVMDETTPLASWGELLPARTLWIYDPATRAPILEIVSLLRSANPRWNFREISGGGHMAPLTRPETVNPIVEEFLSAQGLGSE